MRFIRGALAGMTLAAILIGVPTVLVMVAGNPMPSEEQIRAVLALQPDFGGRLLFGTVLPIAAWAAWATFAMPALVEIGAQLRGAKAPALHGMQLQQQVAASLVGAIALMLGSGLVTSPSASAATLPPQTVATPAAVTTDLVPAAKAAPTPVASVQSAPSLPTHTVVAGDTLWGLAEAFLGDGARYGEIAQLNQDLLGANPGHLEPGWTLTLPAASAAQQTAASPTHTVLPGETLEHIATLHGTTVEALMAANASQPQPDGQVLTDPDLIRPGWTLTVPGSPAPTAAPRIEAPAAPEASAISANVQAVAPAGTPTIPAEDTAPAPEGSTPGTETAPAAGAPLPGGTFTEAPQLTDTPESATDEADEDFQWPATTVGGIGSLLAAGILASLGLRRLHTRKRRLAGQRAATPSPAAEAFDLQLRTVEEPADVQDLDRALRALAVWAEETGNPLPRMFCARLGDAGAVIYLAAPTQLPAPFVQATDDCTVWTVDPAQIASRDVEDVPAPYPALVTVGHDQTGSSFLLELEHVGALHLNGASPEALPVLTALAGELATSPWGEQLQVTLVGLDSKLPAALGPTRVRRIDDIDQLIIELRGRAADTARALGSLGHETIASARAANDESWAPEVVLLAQPPTQDQQGQLAELVAAVPRLGIASISTERIAGDWTVRLGDGQGILEPVGLTFTPQKVTAEEAAHILELLAAASADPVAHTPAAADLTVADLPTPEPALSIVPDEASTMPAGEAETHPGDDGQALAEDIPAAEQQTEDVPAAAAEVIARVADGIVPDAPTPMVLVLGDVKVLDPAGREPIAQGTDRVSVAAVERCTAFAAFLALNPGATTEAFHNAFWPGTEVTKGRQNRSKLSNLTRNYLGNRADGTPWYPKAGADGYHLDPEIRTDWHVFCELVGTDVSKATTGSLAAALRLVRGQPFSGVKDKNYAWAEISGDAMRVKICDAAHELAARALRSGNSAQARLAGTVGRMVDPVYEQAWRDAMLAAHAAGNHDRVEQLYKGLGDLLDSLEGDFEPEEQTQDLIVQLRTRRRAIAS